MVLWILAYLGGILTILSPCILPVLPFVFSRAEQPFRKSGLPLLLGMAATFAIVSTFAVIGGAWVIHANEWGRWIALLFLTLVALTLIFPQVSELLTRPFLKLGGQLNLSQQGETTFGRSFLLGIATGLLWAPCAGPILGLILTGAAINGASVSTSVLLLAYALGAATSLAIALFAGGKALGLMKRYLGADEWVRKILGLLVLLGVVAIALGWDRGILARLSLLSTGSLERKLVDQVMPKTDDSIPMILPELSGITTWLNSAPLTNGSLKGKVVLIDFWTYSCINCLRSVPYIKAWDEKYRASGLVIIGVHTPEFAFEKKVSNVEQAIKDLGLAYPVAVDNDYAVWNAFNNQYWPAHYFIDTKGIVRHHNFGEGDYDSSEKVIQMLLAEAGAKNTPTDLVNVNAAGRQAAASDIDASPETYLGWDRAENARMSPAIRRDAVESYRVSAKLNVNDWGLTGRWVVSKENASVHASGGKITYRFIGRDLHLVLGPGEAGKPIRFVVRLNGKAPRDNHGLDIDAAGKGTISGQRLYQLIRFKSETNLTDHIFEIEFLDAGGEAYAFTFG